MRSTWCGHGSHVGPLALLFPKCGLGVPCGVLRRGCPVVLCCRWPGRVSGSAHAALPFSDGDMGVMRGKSLGISPRSVQVARLRYSFLAISEK